MAEPPAVARRPISLVTLLTALVGFVLLALTIRQVGWSSVVSGVASVGWMFAVVIALGALRAAMRARAWMVCVISPSGRPFDSGAQVRDLAQDRGQAAADEASAPEEPRLAFVDAFNAFLAADAVGNVTPLGLLASEPTKVLMVRSRLSTVNSVASVAIENACYSVSVIFVLLTGTWLFSQRANLPQPLERAAQVVIGAAIVAAVVALWAARRRPAVLSRFAPLIAMLGGRNRVSADKLREVESRIYDAAHWPLSRLAHIGSWEILFHVFAVAEVWLVLRILPGGAQTSALDAFLMESAGRFVTVAFKFVPFRLGVDEAGSGLVAQVLGIPAVTGVTLALVRRLRILILNAAGFLVLARRR